MIKIRIFKITSIIILSLLNLSLTACVSTPVFYKTNTPRNTALQVNLQDGQVLASNQLQNYNPNTFTIPSGKCQAVMLTPVNHSAMIPLQVCYRDNAFYLDGNKIPFRQTQNAIRFNYIPLWEQGFAYHGISTNGPAHLSGITVSIKIIEPHESANTSH